MQNREAVMGGFVPTEYTSLDGHGTTRIRRVQGGWVVTMLLSHGHENHLPSQPTVEAAVLAFRAYMHRPDNDVEF